MRTIIDKPDPPDNAPWVRIAENGTLWLGHGLATQTCFLINQSGRFSGPQIVDTSTYVQLNPVIETRHLHFQNFPDFGFSGHIKTILS